MIDILTISSDPAHANAIARIVEAGDSHHRVRASTATLLHLCTDKEALDGVDLLIFDGAQLTQQDFDALLAIATRHAELTCMLLTPSPSADLVIRAMRAGVRDVQQWPVDPKDFRHAVERIASKTNRTRREGRVISFVSCKGGSGTSFLAANLAFAASTAGKRALLIDLNQQFGEAAFLVSEMTPPATLADVSAQIERLDPAFLDACMTHVCDSFDVLAGAPDPARAKEIKPEHLQRILNLARPQYDLVIFDVGQNISNVSIAVLDQSECIFSVLQLSLPYLRAGRRLLEIFRSLGYRSDKVRVLVNRYEKKGPVGLPELEKALGLRVTSVIPEDEAAVSASINQGVPILRLARSSGVAKGISELVRSLSPPPADARSGSILQKFFARPALSRA
ncbi:Flp pilus assembly protein, ATPase CpaE [Paraburkholderia piptadeniae]|uniref:Flp pilus assembly protein, ATPase CpaE n=1 Tax=Paraburkholderia piptadeniae TaxID=1701573 RepID=A0A1N7SRT9_9BURK|nr:AAA family ATPase [Paraburkholderia piptadeniae]SIT50181.1 Flp pilus assembly protein, ATPase CpaE [Paraburkholderia piptadeniae]